MISDFRQFNLLTSVSCDESRNWARDSATKVGHQSQGAHTQFDCTANIYFDEGKYSEKNYWEKNPQSQIKDQLYTYICRITEMLKCNAPM